MLRAEFLEDGSGNYMGLEQITREKTLRARTGGTAGQLEYHRTEVKFAQAFF